MDASHDDGRQPGGQGLPEGGGATAAASELVERGLEHYAHGRLLAAIADWEQVLRLAPDHAPAAEYLAAVREYFPPDDADPGTGGAQESDWELDEIQAQPASDPQAVASDDRFERSRTK